MEKIIKVVDLGKALGFPDRISYKNGDPVNDPAYIQLMFLVLADKRLAFKVDEIIEECQILVKELGKQLVRVRNISGATVLGSGRVVPVINVADLMKSNLRPEMDINNLKETPIPVAKNYKILVTDDSITSRTLIKSILESTGYLVETAVDGADAYSKAFNW